VGESERKENFPPQGGRERGDVVGAGARMGESKEWKKSVGGLGGGGGGGGLWFVGWFVGTR